MCVSVKVYQVCAAPTRELGLLGLEFSNSYELPEVLAGN